MTVIPTLDLISARSRKGLSVLLALLLCHAVTAGAAVAGLPGVFLVAAVLGIVMDLLAARNGVLRTLLGRAQLGLINRATLRELSLVILLLRVGDTGAGTHTVPAVAAATAVLALPAVRFLVLALRAPWARRRLRPVEWRNFDVPVPEPWLPPRWARAGLELPVLICSLPVLLGVLAVESGWWVLFGIAVAGSLLALATMAVLMARALAALRAVADDEGYLATVGESARALHPEVALYFSGPAVSMYQLNMWLPVLEASRRRCIVILRERVTLTRMAETTVPIVCLPQSTTLMDFRLPTVRVALYAVNVGKNLHFLREPRIKHVFIGHGESDKVASVNPFTKAHDEIWVAGRAARERWAEADVGIRDETVVEVGRPQLGSILPARPRPAGAPLTVLYAPTWEGWTNDPFATSLVGMGPALVRWLLERPVPTRVIYKPHPLTGTVSVRAKAAHREVVALMDAAGARHTGVSVLGVDLVPADPDDLSADAGPDGVAPLPGSSHLVVVGATPTLYECFNEADVMISDISSVVADFIASEKPYVVTNPAGATHQVLRASYATTRAAYLADPDPAAWEPMLAEVEADDPLAPARSQLRTHLLGPATADPMGRWNDAVDDLIARAELQWPRAELESALAQPE